LRLKKQQSRRRHGSNWMTQQFFRMWPRALFHSKEGLAVLGKHLSNGGVYVLYRDDEPYYIGKTSKPLYKRLKQHALKPNARRYNFWNYFTAFELAESEHRNEIEAVLISAMPTANSAHPKLPRRKLDRDAARLLNDIQALILTGRQDASGETTPDITEDDEE
jgi:hypothetical protein